MVSYRKPEIVFVFLFCCFLFVCLFLRKLSWVRYNILEGENLFQIIRCKYTQDTKQKLKGVYNCYWGKFSQMHTFLILSNCAMSYYGSINPTLLWEFCLHKNCRSGPLLQLWRFRNWVTSSPHSSQTVLYELMAYGAWISPCAPMDINGDKILVLLRSMGISPLTSMGPGFHPGIFLIYFHRAESGSVSWTHRNRALVTFEHRVSKGGAYFHATHSNEL